VPGQQSFSTPDGLLVTVPGDALFNVNKLLHERGEILAAQVHTHPSSAYHSETDDHYPMVTLLGSLSIVIPDFARNAPSDIAAWAWYRLKEYSVWAPLEQQTKVIFE
jgi:proteasome lid subunit RPN8/RPN11